MSGTTSDKPIAAKSVTNAPKSAEKPAAVAPIVSAVASSAPKTADKSASSARATDPSQPAASVTSVASAPASATAQRTVKCPKCGSDVRDVARFCQRCHHTMRYECPSCHHQQRTGGTCEKCGIDFLKYIGAVMSQKHAETDAMHERFEQRSNFMKNLLYLPFTLGFPIIRDYFVKRDRKK
jgi:hypothetical protein